MMNVSNQISGHKWSILSTVWSTESIAWSILSTSTKSTVSSQFCHQCVRGFCERWYGTEKPGKCRYIVLLTQSLTVCIKATTSPTPKKQQKNNSIHLVVETVFGVIETSHVPLTTRQLHKLLYNTVTYSCAELERRRFRYYLGNEWRFRWICRVLTRIFSDGQLTKFF